MAADLGINELSPASSINSEKSTDLPSFALNALHHISVKRQQTSESAHGSGTHVQQTSGSASGGATPHFDTAETIFGDELMGSDYDDDEVDDESYEYKTDDSFDDEPPQQQSQPQPPPPSSSSSSTKISTKPVFGNTSVKLSTVVSVDSYSVEANDTLSMPPAESLTESQSLGAKLNQYKHFQIRSVTIYGDLWKGPDKLRKSQRKFHLRRHNKQSEATATTTAQEDGDDEKSQQRQFIHREIVETEKAYLKGLRTLLHEFIKPIFEQKLMKSKHEKDVTSNVPQLIELHEQFLAAMLGCGDEEEEDELGSLSAVFIKFSPLLAVYIEYVRSYERILAVFAKHRQSKPLQRYLCEKRKQRLPLTNHLILPIQRIPRYMLLLQELKRETPSTHAQYAQLCLALESVQRVADSINERKREIENMSQCLQVMETLRELNRNIVEPHRKYLAQFLFRKRDKQRARNFFVFSDLIVISNLRMKVKQVLDMRTLELKRSCDTSTAFTLFTANKGKPVDYETDADKAEDIGRLDELIVSWRLKVLDGDIARLSMTTDKDETRIALQKNGVCQSLLYREQLERQQKKRVEKDKHKLNQYRKSITVKGDKNKALQMLGQ